MANWDRTANSSSRGRMMRKIGRKLTNELMDEDVYVLDDIVIKESGSGTDTITIGAGGAMAASAVYTLDDVGVSASFVMTAGTQTIAGSKTFSTGITAVSASVSGTNAYAFSDGACSLTENKAAAFSFQDDGTPLLSLGTLTSARSVIVGAGFGSTPPANQTLTNSATVTLPEGLVKVVDNGGAVTGIILAAGIFDGQIIVIANAAAASVTFAASGTSHVAAGTSAIIAANGAMMLVYDSGSSLWYDVH